MKGNEQTKKQKEKDMEVYYGGIDNLFLYIITFPAWIIFGILLVSELKGLFKCVKNWIK